MAFQIKLWGVRGSLPAPETPIEKADRIQRALQSFFAAGYSQSSDIKNFMKRHPDHQLGGYGGHTTCIEVMNNNRHLIIDGGSGIHRKALDMVRSGHPLSGNEIHILMTHFHWDHLIGLPFFVPIFVPGNTIHFHGVQEDLEDVIKQVFTKPFFPVPFDSLGADIQFHKLNPRKPQEVCGFHVTPYQLDHPDPCWGFKIEDEGLAYSHCVDTECKRITQEQLGEDLPLYQNIDLMMFDAQYSIKEVSDKVDWGHATAKFGIDLALREGIKKLVFMHHDPSSSYEKIRSTEDEVYEYCQGMIKQLKTSELPFYEIEWRFAREGQLIPVGNDQ